MAEYLSAITTGVGLPGGSPGFGIWPRFDIWSGFGIWSGGVEHCDFSIESFGEVLGFIGEVGEMARPAEIVAVSESPTPLLRRRQELVEGRSVRTLQVGESFLVEGDRIQELSSNFRNHRSVFGVTGHVSLHLGSGLES